MTYSLDLRNKALKFIENGGTWLSASQTFGVAIRTLAHWIRRKGQNNLPPKARQTGSYKIDEIRLKDYIAKNPDAYLREIAEEFGTTIPAVFWANFKKMIQNNLEKFKTLAEVIDFSFSIVEKQCMQKKI